MYRPSLSRRRLLVPVALGLLLGLVGCAEHGPKLYPVQGTVLLEDGKPLTRGVVVFERVGPGEAVTARGPIKSDGKYQLGTFQPGDGVLPGTYRVLINPMDRADVPDEEKELPFDIKYTKFETSGLQCEVKAEPKEFPIRLTKPEPMPNPPAPAEGRPG